VAGNPAYDRSRNLQPLPGAGVEAAAVAARLGVAPLLDGVVTRDAVIDALTSAHVAHLATHGLLTEDAPASAELALAGVESLTIPDLLGLDTDLDLVVLSACHSGRGRATSAGDVIGLSRALLVAGARQLVVSLWPVEDRDGCLVMDRFYEHLVAGGGGDVAAALQRAAADVRAMPLADRAAAYTALVPDAPAPGGVRGWREEGDDRPAVDDADDPSSWAPFVTIGV
jgi:CHAT domain-containing protein